MEMRTTYALSCQCHWQWAQQTVAKAYTSWPLEVEGLGDGESGRGGGPRVQAAVLKCEHRGLFNLLIQCIVSGTWWHQLRQSRWCLCKVTLKLVGHWPSLWWPCSSLLFKHLLYLNQPSFSAEPDWLFLCRQHHEQIEYIAVLLVSTSCI